jgi:putative ABC transport system substrate-binding protein
MKRREFITLLGGAATAWPLAAQAQQPAVPVVGFLNNASPDRRSKLVQAFGQGLRATGFVEGGNVAIEYRWAHGRNDQLPPMAADLARRQVAAIAAFGHPAVLAARAATATVPIVFLLALDPVAEGLVASLNHPGGNLTGVSTLAIEIAPKRLELLRALFPTATAAALLLNPTNVGNAETTLTAVHEAARVLSFQLQVLRASTDEQIDAAFAKLAQLRPSGLVVGTDGFFISRAEKIAALAFQHKVPAIFHYRPFVTAGGLISYGTRLSDVYYQIGNYIGRILNGDKPADLPIQQPTAVELIINLKTAKALGLDVPAALLARADEVIE